MKHLILSLILALPALAWANPLYYSRCDNTAWVTSDASCVAGSDSNNGLSPSTPKLTPPTSFTTGTTYRFNRAGAWDPWVRVLISTRQDVTFEPYTPASCTGDCATRRPQMAAEVTLNGGTCPNQMFWLTGSSARITIRGLHLIGKANDNTVNPTTEPGGLGCGTHRAVYVIASAVGGNHGHVIEDNLIDRQFHGMQISASDTYAPTNNRNIVVRNNIIRHSVGQGIFGGGDGLLVEGNTFDGNAWVHEMPAVLTKDAHHLYLSSSGTVPARWMTVRGNTFLRHNRKPGAGSSTCSTTIFVGHGNMPDMTVENNLVYEEAATGGCYPIVIDGNTTSGTEAQRMDRIRFRGNVIVVPNAFIMLGCSACPDATFESNTIVSIGSTASQQAIVLNTVGGSSAYQPARGDSAPGKVTVRNNSIYMDSSSGTARGTCLAYRYAEYSTPVPTAEDVIVNNLCVYGPNHPASARAFGLEGAGPSRFAAFSNNVVYKSGATPVWSDAYSTLSAFETAFGSKAASNTQADPNVGTPTLGNGWAMVPNVGSLLIDGGHATRSALTDVDRYLPAGVRRDIGSREYGRTTQAPLGPTGARIQ